MANNYAIDNKTIRFKSNSISHDTIVEIADKLRYSKSESLLLSLETYLRRRGLETECKFKDGRMIVRDLMKLPNGKESIIYATSEYLEHNELNFVLVEVV